MKTPKIFKKNQPKKDSEDIETNNWPYADNGKKNKKQYPVLKKLKVSTMVPSAIETWAKELSSDEEQKGAIREVTYNNQKGFLVISISDEELQNIGFLEKDKLHRQDLGTFSSSLKSNDIKSVTLSKNLNDGYLALLPNEETLFALSEYAEFEDARFNWSFLPTGLDDDDEDAEVFKLNSIVSLKKLNDLSKKPTQLKIVNEQVEEVTDSKAPDKPGKEQETSIVADKPGKEQETSIVADTPGKEQESSIVKDTPGKEQESSIVADTPGKEQESSIVTETPGKEQEKSDEEIFREAMGGDDSDDIDKDESKEKGDEVGTADLVEGRKQLTNVINNADLDINIDVDKILNNLLDLPKINFNEVTESNNSELSNLINEERNNANSDISSMYDNFKSSQKRTVNTKINNLVQKIESSLNLENPNTELGKKRAAILNKYAAKMDESDDALESTKTALQQKYQERKEDYVESVKKQAGDDFDKKHSAELENEIESLRDETKSEIQHQRDNELKSLKDTQQSMAKDLLGNSINEIVGAAEQANNQFLDKIRDLYEYYSDNMKEIGNKYYQEELTRQDNISKQLEFDKTNEKLKNENDELLREMKKLKSGIDAQVISAKQEVSDHKDEIINNLKEEVSNKHQALDNAEQKYASQYQKQLNTLAANNKQLEDSLKSATKQIRLYQYQQNEQPKKYDGNSLKWVVGGVVLVVGIVVGGVIFNSTLTGAKSSSSQQPIIVQTPNQQTSNTSTDDTIDGSTNGYNDGLKGSEKADNADKSEQYQSSYKTGYKKGKAQRQVDNQESSTSNKKKSSNSKTTNLNQSH